MSWANFWLVLILCRTKLRRIYGDNISMYVGRVGFVGPVWPVREIKHLLAGVSINAAWYDKMSTAERFDFSLLVFSFAGAATRTPD